MTAALKTVLVDALNKSLTPDQDTVFGWNSQNVETVLVDGVISIRPNGAESDIYNLDLDATVLATAVRDHFKNQRFEIFETVNQAVRGEITPERAADMIRLAYLTVLNEGLAGGSEG